MTADAWILDRLVALERRVSELEAAATGAGSAPSSARGARLPAGWQPGDDLIAWAKEKFPDVDEASERDKFRDYWISRGEARKDWAAGYRNWIRKAAEFPAPRSSGGTSRPASRVTAVGEINRARRNRFVDKLS